MNKSMFFESLASSYDAEIDDLNSDSEGKTVLAARLKEKRRELKAILPMIEFAPEMVFPVFYGAFKFVSPAAMAAAVRCEPDDDDFPTWDSLSGALAVADWAKPMVEAVLGESGGETFMVAAAAVEFLRAHDTGPASQPAEPTRERNADGEDEGDEDGQDLGEAGADWLAEQGFDSPAS